MERALVVVEPTDAATGLAREAGTLAEGGDAGVVVVHVTTEEEYSGRREAMASLPSTAGEYSPDEAEAGAAQFARDIADEVLADLDVDYETYGYLGEKGETVINAAEEHDCDHVFLAGRRRSPAGKALFGDATQRVILDFDGPTTVVTA